MRESKLSNIVVGALAILFLLFCANLILGLGLGILGLVMSIIGSLLKLLLSKEVLTLGAICLVVYLCTRPKRDRYSDPYHY